MKKISALVVIASLMLALSAQPTEAFSVKAPFKKIAQAGKVVAVKTKQGLVKVGEGLEIAFVAFLAFTYCISSGQCE